jgi:hypothetical protein
MCGTGYSQALCAVCATGYSKSGDECTDCSDASGYGPIITAAVVVLAILTGCLVMSSKTDGAEKTGGASGYSREAEDANEEGGAAKVMAFRAL